MTAVADPTTEPRKLSPAEITARLQKSLEKAFPGMRAADYQELTSDLLDGKVHFGAIPVSIPQGFSMSMHQSAVAIRMAAKPGILRRNLQRAAQQDPVSYWNSTRLMLGSAPWAQDLAAFLADMGWWQQPLAAFTPRGTARLAWNPGEQRLVSGVVELAHGFPR